MSYDDDPDDGWKQCHFCGTYVKENYEDKEKTKPHFLVDCRPDLVEHEIGPLCTWPLLPYDDRDPDDPKYWSKEKTDAFNKEHGRPHCYAYQEFASGEWGTEHIHFSPNNKPADA